jgi:hypothetical protein
MLVSNERRVNGIGGLGVRRGGTEGEDGKGEVDGRFLSRLSS